MKATTRTHSLTLVLDGVSVLDDRHLDALHEAGCDDALFGERDGVQYAAFDREATSFREALTTAIDDVTRAIEGVRVVRIEPDELTSLAAIAERSGRSREYIRLLSTGERGPGGFPAPVVYPDRRTRLWRWPDVAQWLTEHGKAALDVDAEAADLVAALNAAYELRERRSRLRKKRDVALVGDALGDRSFGRC